MEIKDLCTHEQTDGHPSPSSIPQPDQSIASSNDALDELMDLYEAEAQEKAKEALRMANGKRRQPGSLPGMVRGREEGLSRPLAQDNLGFRLMHKMGYRQGQGLGKDAKGQVEPLKPEVRAGVRLGLGVLEDARQQRQQQVAEEARAAATRAAQEARSQERFVRDSSSAYGRRRALDQIWSAWRVLEQLEAEAVSRAEVAEAAMRHSGYVDGDDGGGPATTGARPRQCSATTAADASPEGLKRVLQPLLPAEFRGLKPAPPSTRAVRLVEQLPELWIPAATTGAAGAGAVIDDGEAKGPPPAKHSAKDSGSSATVDVEGTPPSVSVCGQDSKCEVEQREGGKRTPPISPEGRVGEDIIKPGDGKAEDKLGIEGELGVEIAAYSLSEQLDLLLRFLRDKHLYCLHCGCVFESRDQMEASCPGASEDLH